MAAQGKQKTSKIKRGLVLTGGGARAAFQAGALLGLSEILGERFDDTFPFEIISGVSAGAINGAFLASQNTPFSVRARALWNMWGGLKENSVVKTDTFSIGRLGIRWMRQLSTGVSIGTNANFLLDSEPLRQLLTNGIDFEKVYQNIAENKLHGLGLSTTNYRTGTSVTFYDGHEEIGNWSRSARLGLRSRLTVDHVLASASIPLFFKPVEMEGSQFGDGGIRLSTPLSPAIHMGADRILAIGIRYARSEESTLAMNQTSNVKDIALADIAGVLLNALFLDALDADLERLQRINQTLSLIEEGARRQSPSQLRPIPVFTIRPSRDLGSMAGDQFERFPRLLRHLLKGIGASGEKGWDLLSYLAFDSNYTQLLLDLGRQDALNHSEELLNFFLT